MDDPRVAAARALCARAGCKTARRRVIVFDVAGAELVTVLEVGGALEDWRENPGGRRALRRARRTAGPVLFERRAAALSVHAGAGSGITLCAAA